MIERSTHFEREGDRLIHGLADLDREIELPSTRGRQLEIIEQIATIADVNTVEHDRLTLAIDRPCVELHVSAWDPVARRERIARIVKSDVDHQLIATNSEAVPSVEHDAKGAAFRVLGNPILECGHLHVLGWVTTSESERQAEEQQRTSKRGKSHAWMRSKPLASVPSS
jgi:hypothetical protein